MAWRRATNTRELDARRVFPIPVMVACWYDGQFSRVFAAQAEYRGQGEFGRWGGGPLGQCIVTHWDWLPQTPSEASMLEVALQLSGVALK